MAGPMRFRRLLFVRELSWACDPHQLPRGTYTLYVAFREFLIPR